MGSMLYLLVKIYGKLGNGYTFSHSFSQTMDTQIDSSHVSKCNDVRDTLGVAAVYSVLSLFTPRVRRSSDMEEQFKEFTTGLDDIVCQQED
jgi:hypothetical protein